VRVCATGMHTCVCAQVIERHSAVKHTHTHTHSRGARGGGGGSGPILSRCSASDNPASGIVSDDC